MSHSSIHHIFIIVVELMPPSKQQNDSTTINETTIKQSSSIIGGQSSIGYDILISKTKPEVIDDNQNNDNNNNENAEMASTISESRNDSIEKTAPPTSSLHRLCNMFQNMIDELKKVDIRDSETIIDDHDDNNNKGTFLHPSPYDDHHTDDGDHESQQQQMVNEQQPLPLLQKSTITKRQRISRTTVSIVLRVYHRVGTRGHRIGCVHRYRIKPTKNIKQFLKQIETIKSKPKLVRKKQRNLIQSTTTTTQHHDDERKIEQISIVEKNSENRTERSRSTGDVLILGNSTGKKPPLCRLTNNRAFSLTLDDLKFHQHDQMEQINNEANCDFDCGDERLKAIDQDDDGVDDNDDKLVNLNKRLPLRSSWRRKNFYKRRESLDEYLQRKVFKMNENENDSESSPLIMMDNNRILKFQSNNPWLNYIKTCGQRKIDWESLTTEQIMMYESMFELIVTEKSYLVVCNCLIQILHLVLKSHVSIITIK